MHGFIPIISYLSCTGNFGQFTTSKKKHVVKWTKHDEFGDIEVVASSSMHPLSCYLPPSNCGLLTQI
jgi:hypothetical protein